MTITKIVLYAVTFAVSSLAGISQTPVACSNMSLGTNGALNGFVPSPNDAWHQDISGAQVDPNSTTIVTTAIDLSGASLHPDFGSIAGGGYGIPYLVVDSANTPKVPVSITTYTTESDMTLAPIPADAPIESNPGDCNATQWDRHMIVVDRNQCVVYEYWKALHCSAGFSAATTALFDFKITQKRPYTYTSADAAGLSIFEGLIRYDEIVAGEINHAIRFTAARTKDNAQTGFFTAPATHSAGNNWGTDNIMGMRIRLRADYDISGFSQTNQIILKAMKKYGMILADNGSNMFFQGTTDARWVDSDLNRLKTINSTAFEVVKMDTVYTSLTAPKGAKPVINSFTASSATVASGTEVTLTPNVTGASYTYIENVGFVRGAATVKPTVTTTYLLTSRNEFGTASATTTVTVSGSSSTPTLTFAAIAGRAYGSAAFAVSATSQSTGAVTYSITSGPATIAGNVVTLTGVGTVVVKATQAAAGNYATTTATTSFAVSAGDPALAFVAVAGKTVGTAPFTVSTTTKSAGSIAYTVASGPATIAGNTVTVNAAGTVTLKATQAASGNYAAGTATTSFAVTAATTTTPVLTFGAVPAKTYGAAPFAVVATSASKGAVSYTVVSGPATIAGSTVTLTGAGTVTLKATQAASGTYAAATATTSFTVSGATPVLVFGPNAAKILFSDPPFAVSATSASAGAVTYTVASGPATISGKTVTLTGAGTVVVRATQAAAGAYLSATQTRTFVIGAGYSSLAITLIANQKLVGVSITVPLSSTSHSNGAVAYSVTGPATVSGDVLTITGAADKVTVKATQAATTDYAGATSSTSFTVRR